MAPGQPSPIDPADILTARRLGNAIAALAGPNHSSSDPVFQLERNEREAIRQAVGGSSHPLAGFSHSLLDQWGDLEDDDRVAGLLLFAELVKRPERARGIDDGRRVER